VLYSPNTADTHPSFTVASCPAEPEQRAMGPGAVLERCGVTPGKGWISTSSEGLQQPTDLLSTPWYTLW